MSIPTTPDRHAWAKPQVEEVADGVFRIPLPMPNDGLRAVNVYVVIGEERISVIDSGWAIPSSRETLERGLASLGKKVADIRQFLVTHLHPDHYAQASVLQAELGIRVSLGEGEQPSLDLMLNNMSGKADPNARRARLDRAGAQALADTLPPIPSRPGAELQWRRPDEWLVGGQVVRAESRRLTVVPTPGHTHGHVVFHDESAGLLFSGDHILPQITPSIGQEISAVQWPLRDYLDSLALIKGRPDARLLPAHGPVWESAHRRVDELIAHHEQRLKDVLRAVEDGASTGWEVADRLTWTYRELALQELDVSNQSMAVQETVAHLKVLVLEGMLELDPAGDTDHFAVPRDDSASGGAHA